jgi:hypothetical protein
VKINIFRNPFIDAQAGYLIDMMVDARRKETEAYWREVLAKEHEEDLDVEYWRGYNNGYMDGYSDAEAHYDDWVYTNEDNEEMSTNDDIDQMSANDDKNGGTQ